MRRRSDGVLGLGGGGEGGAPGGGIYLRDDRGDGEWEWERVWNCVEIDNVFFFFFFF